MIKIFTIYNITYKKSILVSKYNINKKIKIFTSNYIIHQETVALLYEFETDIYNQLSNYIMFCIVCDI